MGFGTVASLLVAGFVGLCESAKSGNGGGNSIDSTNSSADDDSYDLPDSGDSSEIYFVNTSSADGVLLSSTEAEQVNEKFEKEEDFAGVIVAFAVVCAVLVILMVARKRYCPSNNRGSTKTTIRALQGQAQLTAKKIDVKVKKQLENAKMKLQSNKHPKRSNYDQIGALTNDVDVERRNGNHNREVNGGDRGQSGKMDQTVPFPSDSEESDMTDGSNDDGSDDMSEEEEDEDASQSDSREDDENEDDQDNKQYVIKNVDV